MIKVGVIGATGYTGEEIVKILTRHRGVKITALQAVVEKEEPISLIFPSLAGKLDLVCEKPDIEKAKKMAEVFFLALPHRVSMSVAPELLRAGKKVIDLSADYRLETAEYEKWYGVKHRDAGNIEKAVYGLPELFADEVKKAKLLANPGCYPTGAILGAAPLAAKNLIGLDTIIIDSKSGATGAGRKALISLSFSEVNENLRAYKINQHQHKPEVNAILGKLAKKKIDVIFVPHLVPLNRGILSTIYMDLKEDLGESEVIELYRNFYGGKPFVKISPPGSLPALRDVQFSNSCHIGVKVTGKKAIAVSCIDNLMKGAAGQAVQNMNIMCGFEESEALA